MSDTPEPEQKPKSIQDLISLAGTITPIIVGASFLLSICYDFFFLSTLGLSFSDIPSQISDHVRSAILWLPQIAGFTSFIAIPLSLFLGSNDNNGNSPQKYRRIETYILNACLYSMLFSSLLFLSTDTQTPALATVSIFASYIYVRKYQFHHPFAEKYFVFAIFTALTISITATYANRDAKEILLTQKHALLIKTKVNDVVSEIKSNGIRRFSEFSIIVDENRQVIILPKDAILSTKNINPVVIQESLVCEFFKIKCADKVTPPSKAASSP